MVHETDCYPVDEINEPRLVLFRQNARNQLLLLEKGFVSVFHVLQEIKILQVVDYCETVFPLAERITNTSPID